MQRKTASPLGVASLSNRNGRFEARMWPDGSVSLVHDGRALPDGSWSVDTILLPDTAIRDDGDRSELRRRLQRSFRAKGEFRLYHYRGVRGLRDGRQKIQEAITILEHQAFYFSNPLDFSDTNDCRLDWDRNLTREEAAEFYRWWLRTKILQYAAEDEYRLIDFAQNGVSDNRLRTVDALRGIILGAMIEEQDRRSLLESAQKHRPGMPIHQARLTAFGKVVLELTTAG